MGVVYVTEADVVTGGYTYRSKLATLRKVHFYTYIFNNPVFFILREQNLIFHSQILMKACK